MNQTKRVKILGIPFDALTIEETVERIDEAISNKCHVRHAAVNAATLVDIQHDPDLKKSVSSCDIINADGKSIVWVSRLLRKPLPERVAGPDLVNIIVKLAATKKYRIFLLGAKEEVVKKVALEYTSRFSKSIVAGYHHGYFSKEEEEQIVDQIAKSNADILFVAISSPKKEVFLMQYEKALHVPFIMGVGGVFDIVAGITKRAPYWMQKSGLEWFYRFLQEPRRMWKRYLVSNSLFIYYVFRELIANYYAHINIVKKR